MKISVAMACFNGNEFILDQLTSLENQSTPPDEVIISDDLSSDNTPKLIENYIVNNSLQNWHFSVNENRMGFIDNFRRALSRCSGDIVFLCDQDDVWACDKIRIMAEIMSSNANVLSLASSYDIINRFGEKSELKLRPMYSASQKMSRGELRRVQGRLLQGNIAQGCTCAYRRSLVEEYLEKGEGVGIPHDWALNLLAFEKGGLYYLNLPLVSYRIHGDNTTGAITDESSVSDRAAILKELAEKTEKAVALVPDEGEKYLEFADFIRFRAEISESGGLASFLKGFAKYPKYVFGGSFLQYCKDFYSGNKTGNR